MLIAVKRNKFIVLFIIIFGTLSFPIGTGYATSTLATGVQNGTFLIDN